MHEVLSDTIRQAYLTKFINGYTECALWSSVTEDGEPMDRDHGMDDLTNRARDAFRDDCAKFVEENWVFLLDAPRNAEECGHDLWLSRNGHGSGFWDRDMGEVGEALHNAAKSMGECSLYVTDSGEVDVM